ncbi:outer membrane efflux protein [Leptospira weilii serovar Topaz str. LT2116]|uniref:Outer membrane efflux protein n=1 Tax=Leptospira weilii serovar Topaz str. LT2116 TaxID=1088540 RepID=M3H561_9LEPT|nr:outer membrane efflux protein [Leptospira weilii serovar Topaz str. LT2116]
MVSSQNVLRTPRGESFFKNEVRNFPKQYRNEVGTLSRFKLPIFFLEKTESRRMRGFKSGKFANTIFVFSFLGFVFPLSWVYPEVIPFEPHFVTEEKKSGPSFDEEKSPIFQEGQTQTEVGANPIPSFSGKIIDWDVEKLTEYAVSNNPLYLAEKQNMRIERGKVITASLYRNPTIQLQQQFIGVPGGGGSSGPQILGANGSQGGHMEVAPALYQDLDVYGVVSLRSKVAKKSFEAVLGEFDNFDRLFRLRLRQNYWAYIFLTNLVDYNKEFYENYSDLLELTKFRVEKGDISPLEYERLELERIQVEKFYRDALVRRQFVEKELRILSGIREAEGVFAFKTEMRFKSLEDLGLRLREITTVNRPDIAALEERVKEKKLNIDLQRREALGYVQVGGEWRIKGNEHYAGVFATVPLPLNDRGQGKVLSAKEEHKKFELALEAKKGKSTKRLRLPRRNFLRERIFLQSTKESICYRKTNSWSKNPG